MLSITSTFQTSGWINAVIVLAIAALSILAATVIWQPQTKNIQSQLYLAYGIVLFVFTIFYAPQQWSNALAVPELRDWVTQLGQIVVGFIGLGLAITCASTWRRLQDGAFFTAREALESLGILSVVILPAIMATFYSTGHEMAFLLVITAIVTSIIGFALSYRVAIKGLRGLSTCALALVLLRFIVEAFNAVELSWPILILIIGILLFVLAIIMASRHQLGTSLSQWYAQKPAGGWYGLGEQRPEAPSQQKDGVVVSEVRREDGTTVRFMTGGKDDSHTSLLAVTILMIIALTICLSIAASYWY
jgi:hypothetical protein